MPIILWIEVGACALSLLLGTASAVTVLAQGLDRRLNQLLAAVLALLSLWAGAALTLRFLLWLDAGAPQAWLALATVALSGAAILLPTVISRYLGVSSRVSDLAAASGLVALILSAIPAFGGVLVSEPGLAPAGTVTYDVLPAGYAASLLSVSSLLWGLTLLSRHRERRPVSRLTLVISLILVGYVLGGALRPFLPLPILTVAVAIAVGDVVYLVVAERSFSPTPTRIAQLERTVAERERDLIAAETRFEDVSSRLAQRTRQLRTASTIAREAAGIRDVEALLQKTVRLISERFGFYHAGVFLLDQPNEYAVLRAASSPGGRRMLERGHRLQVGEEGIVGSVAASGEARIALDVGADAAFFDNPDLPETRSEVALPLVARGRIIGALDVQSQRAEAFGQEDIEVLQTLADQVAIAITNARLLRRAEEAVEAERQARGLLTREAWQRLLRSESDLNARYDPQGVLAGEAPWGDAAMRAVEEGRVVHGGVDGSDSEPGLRRLVVPILLRGQVLGVLDARKAPEAPDTDPWTQEKIELLESLSHQLAVALETARLHEDTMQRAARERLITEVAAEMRESLDLTTVLKTGARGIREAMALPAVTIRLVDEDVEPDEATDDE